MYDINKLIKYKKLITPRNYDPDVLISYLNNNYVCEDITSTFVFSNYYRMIMGNYHHTVATNAKPDIIIYKVSESKDSPILHTEHFEKDEPIIVFIEKKSGYIESNSSELFFQLTLLKSVSQLDYDTNSEKLYELLALIDAAVTSDD
jgi:hypothetical protein